MKVYVVVADIKDEFGEDWNTCIDSIYSSKEKALARCQEVHDPYCDFCISEFNLYDGDDDE